MQTSDGHQTRPLIDDVDTLYIARPDAAYDTIGAASEEAQRWQVVTDQLNAYDGDNVWDVIHALADYDSAATENVDARAFGRDRGEVFVAGNIVYIHDPYTSRWS